MKNIKYRYPYYCPKCSRTVYFDSEEEINEICKICKKKMERKEPYKIDLEEEKNKQKKYLQTISQSKTQPNNYFKCTLSPNNRNLAPNERTQNNRTLNERAYACYTSTPITKPIVTCPYCNSTDTKKISLTSKAVNTALFGFLGTKRHKQWHCNRCGSDF